MAISEPLPQYDGAHARKLRESHAIYDIPQSSACTTVKSVSLKKSEVISFKSLTNTKKQKKVCAGTTKVIKIIKLNLHGAHEINPF